MEQVVLCILIADFLTGFFHWIEDTYGVPSWFLIGEPVILPNIDHHRNPTKFTMGAWLTRNSHPLLIAFLFLILLWFFNWFTWQVALVIVVAAMGNEVHAWSHQKYNHPIVVFLQQTGLVLSKAQHAKHHKPPYDKYFCTITNVMNPILEAIRFWSFLEWTLSQVGIHPKRLSAERDGF